MKCLRHMFALALATVVFGTIGCGSDQATNPTPTTPTSASPLARFVPVATEFVVAIDVSDSTSADELSATVDALLSTFRDEDVFDLMGSASIAVVAYGDTIAPVVDPFVTLDQTTLETTVGPALEGLESDRLVSGAGATLDDALVWASGLLDAGTTTNQHVLVIAGGHGFDALSVETVCATLEVAGVQVHVVGLAVEGGPADVLAACADSTGGGFVNVDDSADIADAVRTLVAGATVVELTLDPATAELVEGEMHGVTATVSRGVGDTAETVEGIEVVFEVVEGPNAGLADTLTTGAEGTAVFEFVGDAGAGTDVVEARVQHPDGDAVIVQQATVTWAGLVRSLTLAPETAELARDAEHTVTATVTEGVEGSEEPGQPIEGLEVVFEIVDGPNAGLTDTLSTAADGTVAFAFVGDGGPGTDTVEARIAQRNSDETVVASATVTWLNAAPTCDAGGPYAATVESDEVRVVLDATASSDADGDELSFLWSVMGPGLELVGADTATPELIVTGDGLCNGTIEVALEVSDGFDTSTCTAMIDLTDMRPPVIVPADAIVELWPVNHRWQTITPDMTLASVEDACSDLGTVDVVVLSVTSDEAFEMVGSGNTKPDVVIHCDGSVELRAERSGTSDGRVYTITYAVTDADGLTTTADVEVHVPHDQSGSGAVAGDVMEHVDADCGDSAR